MSKDMAQNGTQEEEKKPGIVRKITKITFTVGPIRQEDLSTPELNKLMAMAKKFEISFDTVTILDSDQTDKLGYITLPFEITSQEYLLLLYDRLSNLKLSPSRDISVKFPDEFKKYIDEMRAKTAEERKQKLEAAKKKAEQMKRSVYATWVDKDSGELSLKEKFPDAESVTVNQYNFQWYGVIVFESQEKALEVMKSNSYKLDIEGKEVKLVRQCPDQSEIPKDKETPSPRRPASSHSGGGSGGRGGRGGMRSGGGGMNRPQSGGNYGNQGGPRSLLSMGGGGGFGGGGGMMGRGMGRGGGGGQFGNYGGGYGGGYGMQQQGFGGGPNMLGAKRKSDFQEFGGSPKKPFSGGYGGGGGWNRF